MRSEYWSEFEGLDHPATVPGILEFLGAGKIRLLSYWRLIPTPETDNFITCPGLNLESQDSFVSAL
jgi:hypothetical protein